MSEYRRRIAVGLKPGPANGYLVFRQAKMSNVGRVRLAVLYLYVRILNSMWPHSTLTTPSMTARRQSIAA